MRAEKLRRSLICGLGSLEFALASLGQGAERGTALFGALDQCLGDTFAEIVLFADRALLAYSYKCNFQVRPRAGIEITFEHRRNTLIHWGEQAPSLATL